MNTVGLGGVSHDPKLLRGQKSSAPIPLQRSELDKPESQPISFAQAQAFKTLTFGGNLLGQMPGLEIQAKLIDELKTSKDVDEKIIAADMLGQAQVIRAIPALIDLLKPSEPIAVQSAAVRALGFIGNATNANSYTRTSLNKELIKQYEASKDAIRQQVSSNKLDPTLMGRVSSLETRQDRVEALKEIAVAISRLNVETGRNQLLQEYKKSLEASEQNQIVSDEIRRAINLAKEDFIRSLEQQFQKPIEEIVGSLSPSEIRKLNGSIKVTLPGGQEIGVRQAEDVLRDLEVEQKFSAHMLLGLMDGLSHHNDSQINNILKLGLANPHPKVKAKSLAVLGDRNELNYITDIYPNLTSADKGVRRAALNALLQSNDPSARQSLMDFLKPAKFFGLLGEMPSKENMRVYVQFLTHLAKNGDNYIQPLAKVASNQDFDLERRSLAMLVIQSMSQMPHRKNISGQTLAHGQLILQSMAVRPTGKTREERDEVSLFATTLWVGLKDPRAVNIAVKLADDRFRGLTPKDQENLLEAVFMALQDDYSRARRDDADADSVARHVLGIMKKGDKEGVTLQQLEALEKSMKPDSIQKMLKGTLEDVAKGAKPAIQESPFVDEVRAQAPGLVPILSKLLKHEKSIPIRMISARILGLMQAKDAVNQLIAQTRDPLQGLIDWSKDPAFEGNPTFEGANMRLNNLVALGQIGDPKGADVMVDALDDPVLRRYVFEPMGQLGASVSKENNPVTLKKVRDKLNYILSNQNTTRAQRAIRMGAADTMFQYAGGTEELKKFIDNSTQPEFKRHAASAFLKNGYAIDPTHADHAYVKPLLTQGMGIEKLHQAGLTGQGVEIGIVDGGYVDQGNAEAFQDRVRLPAKAAKTDSAHPSMVMTTAGGNGVIKGVAPGVVAYSEMWPDFEGKDPMEVYKKIIEGKIRGENNIKVINNSWGFSDSNILVFKDVRHILKEFKKVVNLAEKAGILFVFAAGNEGEETGIPGVGTLSLFGMDIDKLTNEEATDLNYIMDKVVMVGAANPLGTDDVKQHRLAEFSSLGDSLNRKLLPTLLAPGVDMSVYGYEKGKRTKELVNGTSFAAPFVTGLSALLWQKNPKLTPAQIREVLKTTAIPLPNLPDTYQGVGEVDPQAAVKMAESLGKKRRKPRIAEQPKPEQGKPEEPKAVVAEVQPQVPAPPPPQVPDAPQTPPQKSPEVPPQLETPPEKPPEKKAS